MLFECADSTGFVAEHWSCAQKRAGAGVDEWVYGWSWSLFLCVCRKLPMPLYPREGLWVQRELFPQNHPPVCILALSWKSRKTHWKHLSALIFTFYNVHFCMCVFSWNRYVISVPKMRKCVCFCECVAGITIFMVFSFQWQLSMTQDICVKEYMCVCACIHVWERENCVCCWLCLELWSSLLLVVWWLAVGTDCERILNVPFILMWPYAVYWMLISKN